MTSFFLETFSFTKIFEQFTRFFFEMKKNLNGKLSKNTDSRKPDSVCLQKIKISESFFKSFLVYSSS